MHRKTTIQQLAEQYGVSVRTIQRDLNMIEVPEEHEDYTRYTLINHIDGRSGGIVAEDGWYASDRYLTEEQVYFLEAIRNDIIPDNVKKLAESILRAFAKPGSYKL